MTSAQPSHLPKASPLNTITLGVRGSRHEFRAGRGRGYSSVYDSHHIKFLNSQHIRRQKLSWQTTSNNVTALDPHWVWTSFLPRANSVTLSSITRRSPDRPSCLISGLLVIMSGKYSLVRLEWSSQNTSTLLKFTFWECAQFWMQPKDWSIVL